MVRLSFSDPRALIMRRRFTSDGGALVAQYVLETSGGEAPVRAGWLLGTCAQYEIFTPPLLVFVPAIEKLSSPNLNLHLIKSWSPRSRSEFIDMPVYQFTKILVAIDLSSSFSPSRFKRK